MIPATPRDPIRDELYEYRLTSYATGLQANHPACERAQQAPVAPPRPRKFNPGDLCRTINDGNGVGDSVVVQVHRYCSDWGGGEKVLAGPNWSFEESSLERIFSADEHLALARTSDLKPGDWVQWKEEFSCPRYLDHFQKVFLVRAVKDDLTVKVSNIAHPPDYTGMTFPKVLFKKYELPNMETAVPKFNVGDDVILQWVNDRTQYKGFVAGLPNAEGRYVNFYDILIYGHGRGHYDPKVIRLDEEANQPDANGHRHVWTLKWDATYRSCECGVKQWALNCWTGYNWSNNLPDQQQEAHPHLDPDKVQTGQPPGWTTQPWRIRSYGVIPTRILNTPITLIGAGSVGSFTALALMKMGFKNLTVWDPQDVAIENVGNQLYGGFHVGKSKVSQLQDLLKNCGPGSDEDLDNDPDLITEQHETFGEDSNVAETNEDTYGVVIMAVDSMSARKAIWETIECDSDVGWVIDSRMGAEHASLYVMDTNKEKDCLTYGKTLHSDDDVLQEPCTAAGTVYTAFLLAGMICKAVKDVLTNNPKYTRIMHWNIAENHQMIYHKKTVEDEDAEVEF